jgi:hypothetical protein
MMTSRALLRPLLLILTLCALVAAPAHSFAQGGDDPPATPEPGDLEWRGLVQARPEGGANGVWTVGGKPFVVSDGTFFDGFAGARPAVGACVEVKYVVEAERNLALRVQPEDSCGAPGAPGELDFVRARVDARPAAGRAGAWRIGGRSFQATSATVFAAPYSADDPSKPAVGDCVAAAYSERNDVRTLAAVRPAVCEGDQPPPGTQEFEAHGLLSARPEGKAGAWVIGGVSYTATDATELTEAFGALKAGACVQVHYTPGDAGARVAREIASRPPFRCTPSDEDHVLYGVIAGLPSTPDLTGTWRIGGPGAAVSVVVTQATVLEDGPFVVGRMVKVEFTRGGDGALLAGKVEGLGPERGENPERARGKAYGKIEALPSTSDLRGAWKVAGASYTVGERTRLRDQGRPFAAGDCVEIYFVVGQDGARAAVKVERAGGDDCADGAQEIGRAYGYVEALPAQGFVGAWTVGGVTYGVVAATEFAFEGSVGAPTVGSFVEVRYVVVEGQKVARKIRTLVPPGAGDDNRIGTLTIENTSLAAAGSRWSVGGVSYVVTDDTMLEDSITALANGTLVRVNAYTDPATGQRIATRVAAVGAVYLPLTRR